MDFKRYRFTTSADAEFTRTLRKRVDEYFKTHQIKRQGNSRMVTKSILILIAAFTPLIVMLTGVITHMGLLFLLWLFMGLAMATIGTAVMHDANHGSYSKNKWLNKLAANTILLLGASKKMWTIQHNVLHHTFTNIEHADEDIDVKGIMRFSPNQPLKKIHRYQHIYAWFLYSLGTIAWITVKDFKSLFRYRNMGLLKSKKEFRDAFTEIVVCKLVYYSIMLVLPLIFIPAPWWAIILMFLSMHLILGFTISVIFQTAHVVPNTKFTAEMENPVIEDSWHVHQLKTTANFAPKSKIVTALTGALNFQVEHHLFPNICHIHYPKIAPIVRQTAKEFNLPYHSNGSFLKAVIAHGKMLWQLGRPQTA